MLDVPKETNLKEIKSNVQLSHCHSSRVFKKAQKEVNNKCPQIIIRLEGGAKHPPRLEENPSYNMGCDTPLTLRHGSAKYPCNKRVRELTLKQSHHSQNFRS